MNQQGMRVTVDAAMRTRDVSRPRPEDAEPTTKAAPAAKSTKAGRGERRRLAKRRAARSRTAE